MIASLTCLKLRIDYFLAVICTALDQRHDVGGDRFHDVPVLGGVIVNIINIADAAFLVILDAIHRGSAELQLSDSGAVGPSQVMRRRAINAKLPADPTHRIIQAVDRTAA